MLHDRTRGASPLNILFVILLIAMLTISPSTGKTIADCKGTLYPTQDKESGLWGYCDCHGNMVIGFKFEKAYAFRGSFAKAVASHNEIRSDYKGFDGIIDITGSWILQPHYIVTSVDNFLHPIGLIEEGIYVVESNDGFGFFDIPSGYFSGIQFDFLSEALWYGSYLDDRIICVERNNRKGFASRQTGEICVEFLYSPFFQYYFQGEYCAVRKENSNETVIIDRKNNTIPIPSGFHIAEGNIQVNGGMIPVCDNKTYLYGYSDTRGNMRIQAQYKFAYSFSEGVAVVQTCDEKWLVISSENECLFLLPAWFSPETSNPFCKHGLFECWRETETKKKVVYIDIHGSIRLELDTEGLFATSSFMPNGIAFYFVDHGDDESRCGIINDRGEILTRAVFASIPEEYEMEYANESLLPLQDAQTQKYGYVDLSGQWVIQPSFAFCDRFINGFAIVQQDNDICVIDKKGNVSIVLYSVSPSETGYMFLY